MTTVVNNPAPSNESNGMGFMVGVVLLVIFGIAFFYWGIPALRSVNQQQVPQINVPDKIDVNVNPPNTEQTQ